MEAMAQAGGIIMMHELPDRDEKLVVFTGIERAKFRRPVTPGDQLRIEVEVLSFRTSAGRIDGKAYVDGKLACEATLTCRVVPRNRQRQAGRRRQGRGAGHRSEAQPVGTRSEHSSQRDRCAGRSNPGLLHDRPIFDHRARSGAGR